jgi:hypothetical protein
MSALRGLQGLFAAAAIIPYGCRSQRQPAVIAVGVPSSASSSAALEGERFVELTAGVDFTCGRSSTTHVYCWGSNHDHLFGQDLPLALERPTRISGLDGARAIAAPDVSVRAVCSLRDRGQVWCISATDAGAAHEVVVLDGAEAIAVGPAHACVRARSGKVACGLAGLRGLADAPAQGWPYPDAAAFAASWVGWPSGGDVTTLTASGNRLCVVRANPNGEATCVVDGDNADGVLGIQGVQSVVAWDAGVCGWAGTSWKCSHPAAALDVTARAFLKAPTGDVFIDGSYPKHICVVTANGQLDCRPIPGEADWGMSSFSIRDWPVSHVVFGRSHGCILGRDGTARCWGTREDGRLGVGGASSSTGSTPIVGLTHVVELVAQDRDYCARHADGRVSCWGSLGGHAPEVVETRGPVSAIGSAWPFCVQRANTKVWACRRGGYREGAWLAPAFPGVAHVKSLWAYDGLDLHAVTQGGELLSWEPPLTDPSPATSPVRFQLDEWANAQAISPDGACAIDASGEVSCRCDRSDRSLPACVGSAGVFRLEGLGGARDYVVHMRTGDVCALRGDGSVACGHHRSVVVHDTIDTAAFAALSQVKELSQSTGLATGGVGDFKEGGYACAVEASGEVLCWGQVPRASDAHGSLAPVRVPGLPRATHAALGASNGCVIGDDEKVYCWGQDDVGQSSGQPPEKGGEPMPVVMP